MGMNNHSASSSRSAECDALAPLLALRGAGMLDAEEAARVERHVASCPNCQRDAALDSALVKSLRRALLPGAQAAPTLRMEEIMRATEQRETNTVINDAPAARPAAERRGARPRSIAARWAGGLSALAAAVALIVLAVSVFGGFHGGLGGRRGVTPAPTLSPLLAHQTVYQGTSTGIYALRASDTSLRWEYPPASALELRKHAPAVYSLALDIGTLYALVSTSSEGPYPNSALLALDARTGAARWSTAIPNLSMASLLQVGNILIVVPVVNTHVFIGADQITHTVFAFSAANGKRLWSRDLPGWSVSKPVAAGGAVYVSTSTQLIALDVSSGAIRWTTPIVPSASQQSAQFALYNESVALAATGPYVFALATHEVLAGKTVSWETDLYEIAAADGAHIWRNGFEQDQASWASTLTVNGNQVFAPLFGGLGAFSIGASPELQWRLSLNDAPNGGASVTGATYADGVVYVTDAFNAQDGGVVYSRGATYAVRASDGTQLWRSQTYASGSGIMPVVGLGVVFIPSYGALLALRAANGQRLWKYPASNGAVGDMDVIQVG
jgi:outer membrane protein assembly factor BamB